MYPLLGESPLVPKYAPISVAAEGSLLPSTFWKTFSIMSMDLFIVQFHLTMFICTDL